MEKAKMVKLNIGDNTFMGPKSYLNGLVTTQFCHVRRWDTGQLLGALKFTFDVPEKYAKIKRFNKQIDFLPPLYISSMEMNNGNMYEIIQRVLAVYEISSPEYDDDDDIIALLCTIYSFVRGLQRMDKKYRVMRCNTMDAMLQIRYYTHDISGYQFPYSRIDIPSVKISTMMNHIHHWIDVLKGAIAGLIVQHLTRPKTIVNTVKSTNNPHEYLKLVTSYGYSNLDCMAELVYCCNDTPIYSVTMSGIPNRNTWHHTGALIYSCYPYINEEVRDIPMYTVFQFIKWIEEEMGGFDYGKTAMYMHAARLRKPHEYERLLRYCLTCPAIYNSSRRNVREYTLNCYNRLDEEFKCLVGYVHLPESDEDTFYLAIYGKDANGLVRPSKFIDREGKMTDEPVEKFTYNDIMTYYRYSTVDKMIDDALFRYQMKCAGNEVPDTENEAVNFIVNRLIEWHGYDSFIRKFCDTPLLYSFAEKDEPYIAYFQ